MIFMCYRRHINIEEYFILNINMCWWYIHIHVHIHIYYKMYISFLHILDFQILCHYTNKCKPKKGITLAKWVWSINEFWCFFHKFYFFKALAKLQEQSSRLFKQQKKKFTKLYNILFSLTPSGLEAKGN